MESARAHRQLLSVLSPDQISSLPEELAPFRVTNPLTGSPKQPVCMVRPRDVEQLQHLLRAANSGGLNLTVVSSSGTHVRGGFASDHENILVDLSGWNKIEWINRRNRVCMIGPGVTYGELLAALKPHGMTVSMPLAPRSGKSVLAAVMDREPSTWPNRQWDISDPVASTEFLFGTGDRFRTGAAGGPGTLEKQRAAGGAQKSPLGPSQADFHRVLQGAQGSMGIVTWITMRTELLPSIEEPYLLGAESMDKLAPYLYEVQRPWLGEHSFVLNRTAAAMLMSSAGKGTFSGIRKSLPRFVCLQNICGLERLPRKRLKYQKKDIRSIAGKNNLEMTRNLGEVPADALLAAATTPCGERDWRHHLSGNCLSIFFLTTLDRISDHKEAIDRAARNHRIEEEDIGMYVQPVVQNHACHVEFLVPYDPGDDGFVDRVRRFESEAVPGLIESKVFFSRPYGACQDHVYGLNLPNTGILKKIKGIFDPNRVLQRGKWDL